ncbi:probable phosphoglycerate mutase [Micromonospora pattaloongensis]|uniref:Probable phosphoglycerate mutase n=1 Tax=Micromonospora pattaloongensis TaxID=405436 RepID=A0A1H3TBN7_9ACTN|nr:histidine phosphatase family protein [Micromonospora pattaloongensis]SDZ47125.1 probable phosphoglycerate mutase [Micromonospora pattaloongensis]
MPNRFLHLVRHGDALDDGALTEAGVEQARLVGQRLRELPLSAIHHSPLQRAVQTTELIRQYVPDVPVYSSEVVGDYIPPIPDGDRLNGPAAMVCDGVPPDELGRGAALAAAAIERYAVPAERDSHELIVTHNFLIGWFVRHALDAPAWRWLGLNQCNCALTTILYRPNRPPSLVAFNDMGHLPPALRWTGFPPELRI